MIGGAFHAIIVRNVLDLRRSKWMPRWSPFSVVSATARP
jgi:hypothetical protein